MLWHLDPPGVFASLLPGAGGPMLCHPMLPAPSPEPPGCCSPAALWPWQRVVLLESSCRTPSRVPSVSPGRAGRRAPMGAAHPWQVVPKEGLAAGAGVATAVKPSRRCFLAHYFPVTNPLISLQMTLICCKCCFLG